MLITKKINNNVAMAQDADGREVVVFGKGIGFHSTPYELEDASIISRVFHNVDVRVAEALTSISDEALLAAADIVDFASVELDVKLASALTFTLADHIQFALERVAEGLDIMNPLSAEAAFVYPREYAIGQKGVGMVERRCGVKIPAHEASSIALHIVAAEAGEGAGDMTVVMESARLIEEATYIIEEKLGVEIDRNSYAYARFAAHFRYLVGRLMKTAQVESENSSLFEQAAHDFPDVYSCAAAINETLKKEHDWKCSNEELLYLMMHINRLAAKQ